MIEEIIANIIRNRKKYRNAFLAFVFSLLLVTIGLVKTFFVVVITMVGYYTGDRTIFKKVKKIKDILNDIE